MAAANFRLITMPRADQQVRELLFRATSVEFRNKLIDVLRTVADNLRTAPAVVGDPLHKTRKKGGMVYGAVVQQVFIRFAVFEAEKAVFLLEVKPLSRFFPE